MLKTCSKCGSENRDGAAFCSKCGSELPHEEGIKGWWKRQNRSSKFLIITPFAILVLILLLGAFTEPSGYSDVNYDDATVYDNDAADVSGASRTNTFSENGISFSYPDTWEIYIPDESSDDNVVSLKSYEQGMVSILSVYKRSATVDLETERDTWLGALYENGDDVTYVKKTTVDGNSAYIIGSSYYYQGDEGEQEYVVFIEGDYAYDILFTTDDLSLIQDDIDSIIHSFRVD
ncbi:PsbP-related protein [Methanothermobacter defluvii]|uniref:PsbP-related protein n=1 Tax=Methanothermobacter defluvii TaxID=49339 RepID=UPI001475A21C|nr:PsbP-related protein [Methanothermobacter defluvii]MBC7110938.1 zinc-ribbon domain-containing protein [Methanothermobacter sp.]